MPPKSEYTDEIGDEICRRIEVGESVLFISRDPEMPSQQTIYKWRREFQIFAEKYARAREAQADTFVDEIIHIVDTEPDAHKARVRMDARKWHASKHAPKKYGDQLAVTGADGKDLIPEGAADPHRVAHALLLLLQAPAAIEDDSSDR